MSSYITRPEADKGKVPTATCITATTSTEQKRLAGVQLLNDRIVRLGKETVSVQCLLKQLQIEIGSIRHGMLLNFHKR